MARDLAHESNSAGTECKDELATDGGNAEGAETDAEHTSKGLLNRRNYLRLGAAAAATVAGTGAVNTAAAASGDHGMGFDRTVNAIDDLGWDPNGNRPVTDSLRENMVNGTLIELPPGTFLVDETLTQGDLVNWGIRGIGGSVDDARFVVPQGEGLRIFNLRPGSRNILVENLTFDQYDTWDTGIGNAFVVDDNLRILNVKYAGKTPSEGNGGTSALPVYAVDPDGEIVIDGLDISGPTELIDYPDNPIAIFSGPEHKGTLYIRNSHFENRGSHGIYASRTTGDVRIENCYFKNNQNTHARISGEGSYAKNCTFVWDKNNHPNKGEFQSQTGLTFEAGFQGYAGGLAENCTFICKSSADNTGCLKVDGSQGGMTIRDCEFQVDADGVVPIWADAPGDSHMIDGTPDKPWDIQVENIHVHGSGNSAYGNTGTIEIHGRDTTGVRSCCVANAGDRDGVYYSNLDGAVEDANINVNGEAVALENANATTSNITHEQCGYSIKEPTPEETIGGSTGGGSDDGSSGDGSSNPSTPYANDLTVIAEKGSTLFEYEFVVDGKAAPITGGTAGADAGEFADVVTQNDDGTVSITGTAANGGADSFSYEGDVLEVTAGGPMTIRRNGEEVTVDELTVERSTDDGSNTGGSSDDGSSEDDAVEDTPTYANDLTVIAEKGSTLFEYEFVVDGKAAPITGGTAGADAGEFADVVTQNDDGTVSITGTAANGGADSFSYEGDVLEVAAGGPMTIRRNGEEVTVEMLTAKDTIRVFAKEGAELFTYEFVVNGDVERVVDGASPADTGEFADVVTQNDDGTVTVTGTTANGGGDSFSTHGEIVSFRSDGNPVVYRNDERVDWRQLGFPHTVTVEGTGESASYAVTVSGDIQANPAKGTMNSEDSIVGSTAEGAVSGGIDSYQYSGSITDIRLKGKATVYVDGEQVDPTELGLDHALEVVGTGAPSNYGLTVSKELTANPDGNLGAEDVIDGTTATGSVSTEADKFLFSGEITAFELQGDAAVYLNGQQVSPALLTAETDPVLANKFVVQGGGHAADYTFDVSGNVEKAPDISGLENDDTISADGDVETVTGSVENDDDGYRFSGDLTSLAIDGSASINFADLDG